MTRWMKLSGMMSSSLLLGSGCLPDNYWSGVAGGLTSSVINNTLDAAINTPMQWLLNGGFAPWNLWPGLPLWYQWFTNIGV